MSREDYAPNFHTSQEKIANAVKGKYLASNCYFLVRVYQSKNKEYITFMLSELKAFGLSSGEASLRLWKQLTRLSEQAINLISEMKQPSGKPAVSVNDLITRLRKFPKGGNGFCLTEKQERALLKEIRKGIDTRK